MAMTKRNLTVDAETADVLDGTDNASEYVRVVLRQRKMQLFAAISVCRQKRWNASDVIRALPAFVEFLNTIPHVLYMEPAKTPRDVAEHRTYVMLERTLLHTKCVQLAKDSALTFAIRDIAAEWDANRKRVEQNLRRELLDADGN